MKTFIYTGSNKENHSSIISLGRQFGCQNIRKGSIGDKIAQLANAGNGKAIIACEEHPEFFSVDARFAHLEDPWDKEWLRHKLEVIQLYVEGLSISEIAAKTGAATLTVKNIITKFMED